MCKSLMNLLEDAEHGITHSSRKQHTAIVHAVLCAWEERDSYPESAN